MTLISNSSPYSQFFTKDFIFHQEGNSVGSPLGAWVHLAFLSYGVQSILSPSEKTAVENSLGCSINEGYAYVKELVSNQPLVASLILGFWVSPRFADHPVFSNLHASAKALVGATVSTKLPSQDEINAWTNKGSKGLIPEFPVSVDNPDLESIVANIVATKFSWEKPFKEIETPENMKHWDKEKVLIDATAHNLPVFFNTDNKFFVLHSKSSTVLEDKLPAVVFSLLTDETVSKDEAARILNRAITDSEWLASVSMSIAELNPAELPDFIHVYDERRRIVVGNPSEEVRTFLPAWDATVNLDINGAGFSPITQCFSRELSLLVDTKQVAVAAYNKNGYEAAALTYSMIGRAAMPQMAEVDYRTVEVFFNKPYASQTVIRSTTKSGDSLWVNLPLFSAWIDEASDVTDKKFN